MSAKVDMGLNVFHVCCFMFGCLDGFDSFALTSLVVLLSVVFPMVFDVLKLLLCMFKRVPGNNLIHMFMIQGIYLYKGFSLTRDFQL